MKRLRMRQALAWIVPVVLLALLVARSMGKPTATAARGDCGTAAIARIIRPSGREVART